LHRIDLKSILKAQPSRHGSFTFSGPQKKKKEEKNGKTEIHARQEGERVENGLFHTIRLILKPDFAYCFEMK